MPFEKVQGLIQLSTAPGFLWMQFCGRYTVITLNNVIVVRGNVGKLQTVGAVAEISGQVGIFLFYLGLT